MKKNIVLIEDSNFVRSLLKHSLSERGFEVYEAESGEKILRSKRFNPSLSEPGLLDKIKVDLFILDIELEDINGLVILKKLKAHADLKDIPVIVNSSHSDKETIVQAITTGACDYVLKTENFSTILLDKVSRIFEKELSTFEATLSRELDWVKYGGKELSFALITLSDESDREKPVEKESYEKVVAKLKEHIRHYDWIFLLDDKTIAVILPLTTVQAVVILRNRLLEISKKVNEEIATPMKVQLGFSHYPTNASSVKELIEEARKQVK